MKIENLKELEAVMKLCNKHGIRSIEVDGVKLEVELKTEPAIQTTGTAEATNTSEFTEEQLLMWSSGGYNG